MCSAYAYFTGAKRGEIKEANPDATFGDIVSRRNAVYNDIVSFCVNLSHSESVLVFCFRPNSSLQNGRSSVMSRR